MFDFLKDRDLVLHTEPAGSRWCHLFRAAFTTPDGENHTNNPLGCGAAGSRFSDPRVPPRFRVWYGASEFRDAFLETIVRDTGSDIEDAIPIPGSEIFGARWSDVAAGQDLRLVDLADDGCTRMRIDTDVAGARSHVLGRQLSVVLHEHGSAPDGIRYRSRLTGNLNIAVYDRALPKLRIEADGALITHPELSDLIDRYKLKIQRV